MRSENPFESVCDAAKRVGESLKNDGAKVSAVADRFDVLADQWATLTGKKEEDAAA